MTEAASSRQLVNIAEKEFSYQVWQPRTTAPESMFAQNHFYIVLKIPNT